MAADAPRPRIAPAGLTEDGEVVAERIAIPALFTGPLDMLLDPEHRLERDDLTGLAIASLGEAGRHQGERQLLLRWRHVDQQEAVPLHGRVVPEVAFVAVE